MSDYNFKYTNNVFTEIVEKCDLVAINQRIVRNSLQLSELQSVLFNYKMGVIALGLLTLSSIIAYTALDKYHKDRATKNTYASTLIMLTTVLLSATLYICVVKLPQAYIAFDEHKEHMLNMKPSDIASVEFGIDYANVEINGSIYKCSNQETVSKLFLKEPPVLDSTD